MENQKRRTKKVILISFIIITILEVFLFNFKAFRLLLGDYTYQKYTPAEMGFSGLTYIKEWDEYVVDADNAFIEITGINQEIATMKININVSAMQGAQNSLERALPLKIYYTDEGSDYYRYFPQKVIVPAIESSKYIACYTCGTTTKLRLNIPTTGNFETGNTVVENHHNPIYLAKIKIDSVEINTPIPFHFSFLRVAFIWLIVLFIYISTHYFKMPYDDSFATKISDIQNLILLVTVIVFILLANTSIAFYPQKDMYADYYTNAILNKQLHIDYPVSEELLALKNPYDESERTNKRVEDIKRRTDRFINILAQYQSNAGNQDQILNELSRYYEIEEVEQEDEPFYLWDATYYHEKYYVYFGIVPLLLFYVPFTFLTKFYLPHKVVVSLANGVIIWILYKMLLYIYEKYFQKVPFWMLWHSLIILLFGSMVILIGDRPLFYEVSISMGMMFCIYGTYQLMQTNMNSDIQKQDSKRMIKAVISFALAVGCRPTCAVFFISFIPFFYVKIIKNHQNHLKEKVALLLKMGIPVLCMAVFLMYLNYARFGSITEFGLHYQLTVKDNGNIGYRYITMFPVLWKYIFGVPHFVSQFPFYEPQAASSVNYYAYTYVNSFFGGIFFMAPITLFLWGMKKLKSMNDKALKSHLISLGVIAVILLLCVSSLSTIELRYFTDFLWILVLISIITMWHVYMSLESDEGRTILEKVIVGITLVTIISGLLVQKCMRR